MTDTLFFGLSKLIWLLVAPDMLLLLLLLAGWLMLLFGKTTAAKWYIGIVALVLTTLAWLPLGSWLMYPLENHFATNPPLPEKVDGIVVLGGSELSMRSRYRDQVELNASAERNLAFMALARRYPDAKLIYTGGSGNPAHQWARGADIAERLFREQGFDVSRVLFERESRNTYENAIYSKKLAKPGNDEYWLLITSAWHMPRSLGSFCKIGWRITAWPVDHETSPNGLSTPNLGLSENLQLLHTAVHEWAGLLVYYLTEKTAAPLPAGCPVQTNVH